MLAAIESTPGGIGYTSLGLLRLQQPRGVRVLALDGVTPNSEAVVRGSYPWQLAFGLVHHVDASPAVRSFIDFVHSPSGHRVLEEYGYAAPTLG